MPASDIFLWIIIPYISLTISVAGHIWRYKHDQFGWKFEIDHLVVSSLSIARPASSMPRANSNGMEDAKRSHKTS